jgi:transposase
MGYPMEFRQAVAAAYDECGSSAEVAQQFACSAAWVRRLIQRRRETRGSLAEREAKRPDNNKLTSDDLTNLRALVDATPDLTLAELAVALGDKVSVPTVWRATRRLGLTLKKRPSGPRSGTGQTSRRPAPRGSGSSRG